MEEVAQGHHTDPCSFCVTRAAKEAAEKGEALTGTVEEAVEEAVEGAVESLDPAA